MNKVSLQDIANRLGVSKGTVSLVLSGKAKQGRVSQKTILRVKEMAVEMNYFPNEIARSLTTGKTMTLGVIVTDISNEFFGKLAFYIQETAKKYGYTVITTNTNENLDEFEKTVTTLLNRRIDGLILVPVFGAETIAKKILDNNLPMVQIDRYYPGLDANYIVVDNYHISAKATELLIKKGHKKIAVVCYDINLNALTERKRGCIDTLIQYDMLDTSLIKNINYENQEEEIKKTIIDHYCPKKLPHRFS